MTSVDPLIGRDLDGRYTIVEQVGRGNMAVVYRATQHGLGREVAIKVVTPRLGVDTLVIKRFMREARLASRLSHPNAVAVLDFGQTSDGLLYLVMELVKGRTLEDAVKAEGRLYASRVVRIGTQICDALEGAHALQIIHRDLKPANIMLMSSGRDTVKVLDFGLAKSLQPEHASLNMTSVGALLGTPAFMPPESVTGGVVDARADLYSLGCTLYFAAMGKLPFDSPAIAEIIAMHAMEPPPPLAGVQVALARVIERLMAKSPAERYADVIATREALEETLAAGKDVVPGASSSASTPAPTPASPVRRKTPREGTMLGWATPPSGVPLAKPKTSEAVPIARPANDAGVVVKMRASGAAPSTGPSPIVKPSTGPSPIAKPSTGPSPIAKPSTGPSPITKPPTGPSPITKPPTGPSPITKKPPTGPSPVTGATPTAKPSTGESRLVPRATADLPMPSPSAVVRTERADTEVDPDVMASSDTIMAPGHAEPSHERPTPAHNATLAPTRNTAAPNPTPASSTRPTNTATARPTETATKTMLTQRSVSVAWILIILVFIASGALVAYKLLQRASAETEPAPGPTSDPPAPAPSTEPTGSAPAAPAETVPTPTGTPPVSVDAPSAETPSPNETKHAESKPAETKPTETKRKRKTRATDDKPIMRRTPGLGGN